MHILKDYVSITLEGKPLVIAGAPVVLPTLKKAKLEAARLNMLASLGKIESGLYSVRES